MTKVSIHRLTRDQWLDQNWDVDPNLDRYDQYLSALTYYEFSGTVPAMCYHGCEVEIDGICEHGNPSPFIEGGFV